MDIEAKLKRNEKITNEREREREIFVRKAHQSTEDHK